MKTLVTKIVLATSVALGTLVAAGAAYAQPPRYHAVPEVYDTQGNPRYGFGPRVTAQPVDVISGNRQVGRDPDPFIRDQMLREYNSGLHGRGIEPSCLQSCNHLGPGCPIGEQPVHEDDVARLRRGLRSGSGGVTLEKSAA